MSETTKKEKDYPFFCEWCGSIKYCVKPESPEVKPGSTLEDIINMVCNPAPQYICADCLRKILSKE